VNIISGLSLNNLTTFRIGGKARFFCTINNINDVKEGIDFAKNNNLDIFILGGGSNILVSDQGFDGLVMKMEIKGIELNIIDEQEVIVKAYAGENWDDLVKYTVDKNLRGLENLSYIPGTVGASPIQNIGAYGSEVKDSIDFVEVYDIENDKILKLNNSDCDFSYRNSIFKKQKGKYIVISVGFLLHRDNKFNIEYKDLKDYFLKNNVGMLTVQKIRDAVVDIRKNKLPDIKDIGTAGSYFKNPIVSIEKAQSLKNKWSDLPIYPYKEDQVKLSLAWIIDKVCGFKGVSRGDVGTYKNQALVIVNNGNASAKQVYEFANEITKAVKEKTDINIETEVEWVGKL
jgi:UDP-N-acetylmuramate dehydrogenase